MKRGRRPKRTPTTLVIHEELEDAKGMALRARLLEGARRGDPAAIEELQRLRLIPTAPDRRG